MCIRDRPFKTDYEFLPDNYRLSEQRLSNLLKKLEKQPENLKMYGDIFKEYERDGIIEKVPPHDVGEAGCVHYLPHRPIIRTDRNTTKVRPVFDASAKISGPSLNDCLHTGPNLLSMVYDILLRFQLQKVIIMSDIKQAFLNVEVHPDHVNFLRFLWRENGSNAITVYRFLVVVFGLTPSPFLLLATIRYHCEKMVDENKIDKKFTEKFLKTLYMDDSINGGETVDEAFEIYKKSKFLMQSAGFLLRKWNSNNKELLKMITTDDINESSSVTSSITSVLGIKWDTEKDEIIFNFSKIISMDFTNTTKRNVLSVIASFFDPLGYISPITSQGKIIFQLLCKSKINWDDSIHKEILLLWKRFIKLIADVNFVRIKRCVIPELMDTLVNIQLHGFCDSSGFAYCGVIYLRKETSCGFVDVRFLTAKTKVAPIKATTIPRLELLSCVLLSGLVKTVTLPLSELGYDTSITCWNDSMSALGWITNENKDRGPWVQPRVRKSREQIPAEHWRHVPGVLNPADIATREISPSDMNPDSIWFTGPKFLYENPDTWPLSTFDENEVLTDEKNSRTVVVNVVMNDNTFDEIIEVGKYSSLHRLYMLVALILRFKRNMLACIRDHEKRNGSISLNEYRDAEKLIIKHEQFHLQKCDKFNLLKKSLNLFHDDDGILRVKGRLEHSGLKYGQKFPILLRDSHFLHLHIRKCHYDVWHDRVKPTLAKLRLRFWVVRGRQVVKRVIAPCVTCKRHLGKGLLPPQSPSLPEFRVKTDHCFQSTGVDYAGPLLVKSIYGSSTLMNDAYICLFTCATSRAVHLELVPNIEADTFLRALKRFVNRRGKPSLIIDDNAKYFKANSVKSYLLQNGIEHSTILPASPWWGGFYERLVRSVKTPLKKVVGKAKLNYEEMETIIIEIERIINTRPLTYLHDDDVSEPLTPSHLLMGRNLVSDPTDAISLESYSDTLSSRFKYLLSTMQSAWSNFYHHYLTELREHHMYTRPRTDDVNMLKVGDVVIIKDEKVRSRNNWRLGRIESLSIGRDGKVRGVHLQTVSKMFRHTKMSRPVQKIIPLEVV